MKERTLIITWGFFFRCFGGSRTVTLKALINYKDPKLNDCMNHPEWLFWSCETCLRHIRNHLTTENYFLILHFRKLPLENEYSKNTFFGILWRYKGNYYPFTVGVYFSFPPRTLTDETWRGALRKSLCWSNVLGGVNRRAQPR